MSEAQFCERLEISAEARRSTYGQVRFFNHEWEQPQGAPPNRHHHARGNLATHGGLFAMDVPVEINARVFDYDQLIILGPVFPHEVVGFSGGNKYLFPGIGGPQILNFFHWLSAVITNPMIIGKPVDAVGAWWTRPALVQLDKLLLAMVVAPDKSLAGLSRGTPEAAWDAAVQVSKRVHIVTKERPFTPTCLCAPPMYDELWVGGKCMYKLEPRRWRTGAS
jgi:nickel-dependent lactate racemase